jgi:hypothetical protein
VNFHIPLLDRFVHPLREGLRGREEIFEGGKKEFLKNFQKRRSNQTRKKKEEDGPSLYKPSPEREPTSSRRLSWWSFADPVCARLFLFFFLFVPQGHLHTGICVQALVGWLEISVVP